MHLDYFKEQGYLFHDFDEGFVAYNLVKSSKTPHAALCAVYLKPEHRTEKKLELESKMIAHVLEALKKSDIKVLTALVDLAAGNRNEWLKNLLDLGFQINNADAQKIVLFKQV